MQVQHEIQLLEGAPLKAGDFVPSANQSLDTYALTSRPTSLGSIDRLASSPLGSLLAVYCADSKQIILFDTKSHSRRERFPLKSCDKRFSRQSFALSALDYSPDGTKLAVGQTDCIIYIYKLSANTVALPPQNYQAAQQQHSEQQPAPAQSYGSTGTGTALAASRPTITGKFVCSNPIKCLIWTELGIIFGTQDGKVKLISMSSAKSSSSSSSATTNAPAAPDNSVLQSTVAASSTRVIAVYNSPRAVAPLALAFRPPVAAIGFADCTILLITLTPESLLSIDGGGVGLDLLTRRSSGGQVPLVSFVTIEHSCPVYNLALMQNNILCCAGSDGRIALHSFQWDSVSNSSNKAFDSLTGSGRSGAAAALSANWIQNIDLKEDIVAIDYSTVNEILAVATTTRLLFVKHDHESNSWQLQGSFIELANVFALTSVVWAKDGSQLAVGTLMGSIELFRCAWSKHSVSEQLDICHIAKNRVRITDRARNLLATYKTQYDIKRVNLLDNGQSVIIWTSNSLLLARLGQAQLQSELQWSSGREKSSSAKFCFDHPGFVLIYDNSSRELRVVKLGRDQIVYSVKLDYVCKSTTSVRQYPPPPPPSSSPVGGGRASEAGIDKFSPTNRQRSSAGSARSRNSSLGASGPSEQVQPDPPSLLLLQAELTSGTIQQGTTNNSNTRGGLFIESINERLAFASDDCHFLTVINLKSGTRELARRHGDPIVWLELSHTGNSLVFKDSSKKLYLVSLDEQQENNRGSGSSRGRSNNHNNNNNNLEQQQGTTTQPQLLLDECRFVKWFPESDILIAQSSYTIYVWYNIGEDIKKPTTFDSRSYNITKSAPIVDLSFLSQGCKPYPLVASIGPDYLALSNGHLVPLDKVRVRFYTEVLGGRLDTALEILDKEEVQKNLGLWTKLGWLAIEREDCETAVRAFSKLGHKSMVECLEQCLERPEELKWRLAMLKGDWDTFEQIAEPEQIVSTYKRLNKWSRVVDYLTRTQQFRQRDLAEQEHRQWLIDSGRHLEGARIQAKAGDLTGALELLVSNNKFDDAVQLLVSERKSPLGYGSPNKSVRTQAETQLLELASQLKSSLVKEAKFEKAALVCERMLSEPEQALELYLRGDAYEPAIELAKLVAPDRVNALEESFGEHLMRQHKEGQQSRRQALAAIDHFVAAKLDMRALEAAVELSDLNRAYVLLLALKDDDRGATASVDDANTRLEELTGLIGRFKLRQGQINEAIEAFRRGAHYEQIVELYIEQGKFKEAFDTSLRFIHQADRNKTVDEFVRLAEKMTTTDKIDQAETIYLMLDKPDLAMDLHKQRKNYDRMLEIVEQFHPDLLESTLLLLARELESEGRYEAAEKYLLRASDSEWTNVVRMYRLAGKWEDAHRVARDHCSSEQDPLLIQLAYWWAKSLAVSGGDGFEAAHSLLKRLNVFNLVLEFCCENKNYQLAINLCNADSSSRKLRREIVRRYATYLEQQHKFEKAEEVLLQYGQVEEAARMYIDNDMHADAIRVVESRLNKEEEEQQGEMNLMSNDEQQQHNGQRSLVELLNSTLVECANRVAEEVKPVGRQQTMVDNGLRTEMLDKLLTAQKMYLRARRPEAAVALYQERGMWQEAIQVAQRFAPQLLEEVERALDAEVASDIGPIVAASQRRDSRTPGSSSRSSLLTGDGSAIERDPEQTRAALSALDRHLGSPTPLRRKAPDYLQSQAELSMKNGDLRGTKAALEKFMESLL